MCVTYSVCMLEMRIEIPRRIGKIRFYRQPRDGERCKQRLYIRKYDATSSFYDFQLVGDDGECLLTVENFETICIQGGEKQKKPPRAQTKPALAR